MEEGKKVLHPPQVVGQSGDVRDVLGPKFFKTGRSQSCDQRCKNTVAEVGGGDWEP